MTAALMAAATTAALSAAASRPWGLGVLALMAYAPTFVALARLARPASGAVVAAVASLGLGSVAYEAAQGLFPGAYLAALLVATVPYLGVGALVVRLGCALRSRLGGRAATAFTLLAMPSAWAAAEWLPSRPELLGAYALPLGFVGYSQVDLPTGQLARIGSVTLVSHVVLGANAALALCALAVSAVMRAHRPSSATTGLRVRAARLARAAAAALLVLGSAGAFSGGGSGSGSRGPADAIGYTVAALPPAGPVGLTLALVQPNLPDSVYFAASRLSGARAWLQRRLAAGVSTDPDLVVLPEAAWPGPLAGLGLASAAEELAAAFGEARAVLLGAAAVGASSAGERTNSAFLYEAGELRHVYAKRRLVPFGERGLAAGAGPAVVTVGGVPLAPLVCYDAVFPSDARAAVRAGARVLVVLADDAFAAGSDVPELHLRAARMRAIEVGVPVVLAANTGPSAVVDAGGRVLARLPARTAGELPAWVPTGEAGTPYVALGDWVGGANAALTGGLAAAAARGGRTDKRTT